MASDKLFTIAGTSTVKGVNTYRVATGKAKVRTGVLTRNGHTDVDLRDLPSPMTKDDAIAFLQAQGIEATVLKSGRKPAVVLTPEQILEAATEAKRIAKNEARKAARAAAKLLEVKAADDAFLTGAADGSAESLIEATPDVEVISEAPFEVEIPEDVALTPETPAMVESVAE